MFKKHILEKKNKEIFHKTKCNVRKTNEKTEKERVMIEWWYAA